MIWVNNMQNQSSLLSEIFITASDETLENRFNQENTSLAACNGKCISDGGCRAFVDADVE